jgi:glycosyltransferase involved in cell wall biosynthesis
MKLTFAFCTYNRADRLENLVAAMRAQDCPVTFEILAINNNSKDNTLAILKNLADQPGALLRFVTETAPGIVPARNRAIKESLDSDILVFMDDDELPQTGLLNAAYDAIVNEGAQCVGGRVEVDFTPNGRPIWLEDDLLGFLAEVKHGDTPFWITDDSTPIWTANIAYDMRLFRNDPGLRFDQRYNREGADVGGGEDAIMFRALLSRGENIRYRPDMAVRHFVDSWRLKRGYFLKLHYRAGIGYGRLQIPDYDKTILGVPPFLVTQFFKQCLITISKLAHAQPGLLRQAMNAAHALGTINGYRSRQ